MEFGKDNKNHPLRLEVESRIKEIGFDETVIRYFMEILVRLRQIESRQQSIESKLRVHEMDKNIHKVEL